jgi:hypothetical protein
MLRKSSGVAKTVIADCLFEKTLRYRHSFSTVAAGFMEPSRNADRVVMSEVHIVLQDCSKKKCPCARFLPPRTPARLLKVSTRYPVLGCRVVNAPNGRAALTMVGAARPDLVFADVRLRVVAGIEFVRVPNAMPISAEHQ